MRGICGKGVCAEFASFPAVARGCGLPSSAATVFGKFDIGERAQSVPRRVRHLCRNACTKGLSHESIFVRIAPFSLTSITVI